jgi:hypothetical protein
MSIPGKNYCVSDERFEISLRSLIENLLLPVLLFLKKRQLVILDWIDIQGEKINIKFQIIEI